MDKDTALKIIEESYDEDYLAPYCKGGRSGSLIGDALTHTSEREEAAKLLDIFVMVTRVAPQKTQSILIVKHDPALSPIDRCGHKNCCMTKPPKLR